MQLELFALIAFLSFVRRCVALRGADPESRCDGGEDSEERSSGERTRCDPSIRWTASSKKTDDVGSVHACMHGTSSPCLALAQSSVRRSSPSFCLLTRKMAKSPLLSSCSASPALSFILFWPPHSLGLPPSLQLHLMIRSRRRPRPSTQSVSPASLDTDPTLARAVIIKESYFGRTTMIALLRPPPPFGPYFSFFPPALPASLPSSILLFPSIIVLPVPSSKVNHLAVMIIFWLACPCLPLQPKFSST